MLIKRAADIRPSEITPESEYLSRRRFLQTSIDTGLTAAALHTGLYALGNSAWAQTLDNIAEGPWSTSDEALTPLKDLTSYNNFAEFGIQKEDPAKHAHRFNPRPWSIAVDGHCNKPGVYDLEDIIRPHQLEDRIYRLRCVEAWSMVIPWVGFPLANLLQRFEPTASAKYVAFTAVYRPDEMPGLAKPVYEWPFREGLRIDEAMHPLTIFAVGLYGEVLPNVNGAPIRLVVPWKYGFKSIKSIVKISFIEQQPPNTFNMFAPKEFGFYANVNPSVRHPRWAQDKERRIGEFFKRDTLMHNGYAEQVASLYSGMDLTQNF